MQTNANPAYSEFEFLNAYDPKLVLKLTEATELLGHGYYDPSLTSSRLFSELLLHQVAKKSGVPAQGESEPLWIFINRLRDGGHIPRHHADKFHSIREVGNDAAHGEKLATQREAQNVLTKIKELALWFEQIPPVHRPNATTRPTESSSASQSRKAPTVVAFPKSNSSATSPSSDRTPPPPLNQYQRADKERVAEPRNFGAPAVLLAGFVIAALIGGYYWYRSASASSEKIIGPFAQAQMYTVVPGEGAPHVNERGGPGTGYPILAQIGRGLTVAGIARALDSDNASWIELADGRGYIKETLLDPIAASPESAPAPQDTAQTAQQPAPTDQPDTASAETPPTPEPSSAAPSPNPNPPAPVEPQRDIPQSSTPGMAREQSAPPVLFRLTIGVPGQQRGEPRNVFRPPSNERMYRPASPRHGGRP